MIRKVLSVALVIFWMGFIFSFSGSEGDDSSSLSRDLLVKVIEVVTPYNEGDEKLENIVEVLHFPFRKLAHFTIYFILGMLVVNMFLAFNLPKCYILYSVVICIGYAISDEIHQMFTDGRVGSIADVLLDSSGSCIAIYLTNIFIKFRGRSEKSISK